MTQELDTLYSALGEAERYAKELEGKLAEREWQTIDTAPKDGAWILTFEYPVHGDPGIIAITIAHWEDSVDAWTDSEWIKQEPTHWMPLPPPPAT